MTNFNSKAALNRFGAALFTTLLVVILTQDLILPVTPLNRLEQKIIDYRFQERGPIAFKDSADVVILEISQDSYDQIPSPYNSWPWPRSYFAKVIKNLNEAGVKAIGIDIVMSNPDQYSSQNDSILFDAIKKYKNVVVAGKVDVDAEAALENSQSGVVVKKTSENFSNIFFEADSSIGIVQAVSDQDGVYRRYVPYVFSEVNHIKIPSFAYASLNKYFNKPSFYTAQKKDDLFIYEGVRIPVYLNSTILVNYYGSNNTFPRVKFIDVLDDSDFKTVDEIEFQEDINTWDNPAYGLKYSGLFKDKIVFIGSTMPEDKDLIPVSFSEGKREGDNLLYGVEYHANAVQNFLDRNFLVHPDHTTLLIIIILLTLLSFHLTSYAKSIKTKNAYLIEIGVILFVLLLVFALFEISIFVFSHYNTVIPLVDPSIAIILGYVGSTTFEVFTERKRSSMMRGMFSQYVSSNLVSELINNPDKLKLGGENKKLTILFSDIAGFTSFSEGKKPEDVVAFINTFLDEMTDSILAYNGTLDKYLGDSVMAFWGAPIDIPDHAELACKCALDMKRKLERLNKKLNSGDQQIRMRIGINTGEVVVGNIGGKNRFDYTVMGDNVNLSSRLEGANKIYNTSVIISEETNQIIKSKFATRELDLVRVKGKEKPTKIFELIDIRNVVPENLFENYYEGLKNYKAGNFEEAIKCFEREVISSDDPVSKSYIERCQEFKTNPPKGEWKGITTMQEK